MTEGSVEPVPFETFKDIFDTRGVIFKGSHLPLTVLNKKRKEPGKSSITRRDA